jgi:DegV family protein with EDD domain
LDAVLQRVKEVLPKVNLFVTFDTLKYLHRSGRVPAVAALVGSLLKVNPIVYVEDGLVKLLEKPRTKARAVQRMAEIMWERIGARPAHIAVIHADVLDEAREFGKEIASRFNCVELIIAEFTPVMGAFTGPGSLGVAFWAEKGG